MESETFSARLLKWFEKQGRHDLPWQQNRTPYQVWVSEIMLQQTQVVTVIPYFERFIKTFPDIDVLANADLDEVLHHWTGLGYYARARNLHKAAKKIVNECNADFPSSLDDLMSLPGIGRSTAGAIMALAFEQRQPILDGNVKRVLSRYHGIEGWPGKKSVEDKLWSFAELNTPFESVRNYTQAIMDLGATICIRRNPDCDNCPLMMDCFARKYTRQDDFPEKKPKAMTPKRETVFAIIENSQGEILLEQRPASGIWGGLWCFPEFSSEVSISLQIQKKYGLKIKRQIKYKDVKHTFSHFQLMIKPVHILLEGKINRTNDEGMSTWMNLQEGVNIGLPAPVVTMLNEINSKRMVLNES
jgi:A/G-specific adenine glycosylase